MANLGLRRTDLQKIAQTKLKDALLLLDHHRYSNAYYLVGYAVEIGIKACIARQIAPETIPPKSFVDKIFQHRLPELIGLAGLKSELKSEQDRDTSFAASWNLVCQWSPEIRYENVDSYTAQLMVNAVNDETSGVMQWIRRFW